MVLGKIVGGYFMKNNQTSAAIKFEAPGPGSWSIDSVHFPKPCSRVHAELLVPNLTQGFRECALRYGLMVDTLDYRFVNGFGYSMVTPPPEDSIPERIEAAHRVFADKIWREDIAIWDSEAKPAAIKIHMALQSVDPDALSDHDLRQYIESCHDHLAQMIRQHHNFNAAALIPVGDYMAHVSEWTGLPLGEYLALTRGEAPESAGSFHELDRLADAIRNDPATCDLLGSDASDATILEQLQQQPGAVGAAVKAYLDIVANRLLDSLDTAERTVIEAPDVLIAGIRNAVEKGAPAPSTATDDEVARLRNKIPSEHRDMFDELLAETQLMSRIRDERGLYSDVWAAGIFRRALLSAGRRQVDKGRINAAAHLIEGDFQEILAILSSTGGPTASELAERAEYRNTLRVSDAPLLLGDPPSPPPPLDGLPPATVRVMQALGTAINSLFAVSDVQSELSTVRGTGASPGTYTGRARVIDGPDDFGRIQPGDVLVTPTTTEAFNIVIPLLGAIVTNSGGLLSHAAIVSREFGIPGVVGTRDATKQITDGMIVTVDGTAGEVRLDS